MKKCSRCGVVRDLAEFRKNKRYAGGHTTWCKPCEKEYHSAYNRDPRNVERNKLRRRGSEYRACVNPRRRELRADPEYRTKELAKDAEWRRIKRKTDPEWAARQREKAAGRRSTPRARLDNSMGSLVWAALKGKKAGISWQVWVGYSLDDLMSHLEKQFQPGMTWDNYGEWHVDHIVPRSAFNYSAPEHVDFKRCWSLDNLQPLWAEENQRKSDSLEHPFQPALQLAVK